MGNAEKTGEIADIAIIGAGVTGLAIAAEVSRSGRDVFLLEKNDTFGKEQSSRSSEVIHAGIYYAPDSLKARLCLEGNRRIYELCGRYNLPHLPCGKLFIASNDEETETVEELYYNGLNNGLPLKMLSTAELRRLEPHAEGVAAFHSPTSGVVDSHALMRFFFLMAREKEARTVYRAEVAGIEQIPDGYRLEIENPSGVEYLDSRVVINCAGFYSDRVAEMAGIDIDEAGYRLFLTRGEYYSVGNGRNRMLNGLVYPVPQPLGPGVHVCLDVERRLRLGPLFHRADEVNYRMDDSRRSEFEESSIMKILPFILPEDLEPESSGIMCNLYPRGKPPDYIIRHEADRGLPGLINLVGIDSPGITASPAIARYVAGMVDEMLG